MNEEQLEFPVVSGKRAKKATPNDLDFEAHLRGRHFGPQCGCDAAHAIVSNYQVCDRKKAEAEEPKRKLLEPTPVEPMAERTRSGPTEKQKARRRRQPELWREAHPGLRYVQFVIDIELWDQFVASCCATHRPNVVFTRMIREAVMLSEKTEANL